MTKKVMTANRAVSEAVKLAKPKVIPVYPITPQTSISEYLAQFVADGDIDAEYIRVESEHSAISAAVGACGAGVRVFTATSSQGLMLMHEILFAAAGMRMPIVMADANRAISAPLSIWNDQQDSIAQRDSGWMQIYVENGQDALDSILMAYKTSENNKVLLPSMVCLDGFILTHTVEPVEIPSQEQVDKFLPEYKPEHAFLNPEAPMSLGTLTDPDYYMEARYQIEEAMENSLKVIEKTNQEFEEIFGRKYDLVEEYKCEDAEIIIVAMGSICSTVRVCVDEMRDRGEKVGLLKIRVYRPFPQEQIQKAVQNAKKVAVLDKNISFGVGGALYNDIKAKIDIEAYDFIIGLGGRDITPNYIEEVVEKTKNPEKDVTWIGLKE
ncbi:2-ketoisovalerate ferredoxin oxidoreductase subunit alpha [Methanobrevibacter arboriphilus]|jgi:pyruvate ferredoxin oxidoreductase alpha subunit|uniref:2-ketoisovalerate ferredoxin oxidoreductase subunit alpha n=1 Tax=Methanobrevibacter arboriphilus TaxID=39441 RepID=A0ACA8R3G8_METAZ|nr:pyruvate synthase subunit PorA [Methanobrevibacter arboriphilus]BBL61816.1 2-ketoisovalerate ferredoxin oxidoreductase subunit alpha [Methanobrevibacter arboriphilus]GLI10928.1 2-ketoisovalerate ferredoxin oxidoreductase subunit alpha [Methanobrevibacter arboriphilus]